MKLIKAIGVLFISIIELIISFPFMLFIYPVKRYNETLYGKRIVAFKVKELHGNKVQITLPNGERVIADKEV